MSVYLSLDRAWLRRSSGWGQLARTGDQLRLELVDVGELAVCKVGLLGEKKLCSMYITYLELDVGVEQETTGGGYYKVDYNPTNFAPTGIRPNKLMNRLTTRTREYTVLRTRCSYLNGTVVSADFVIGGASEYDLREALGQAVPHWAEGYVLQTLGQIEAMDRVDTDAWFAQVDRMQERRILTPKQALRLRSAASGPFLRHCLATIQSNPPDDPQVTGIVAMLREMVDRGRITQEQAARVIAEIDGRASRARPREPGRSNGTAPRQWPTSAGSAHRRTEPTRTAPAAALSMDESAVRDQLRTLAELRRTGAVDEWDYQAEKARLEQMAASTDDRAR